MPDRDAPAALIAGDDRSTSAARERLTGDMPTFRRAVYERLRQMTVTFELQPGERLIEARLAERLGVSKTPVREAIGLLEADGLVRIVPHRGAVTSWLSMNEMSEQGFLVDALEMPAYPIVLERITEQELASVGRIIKSLTKARKDGDEVSYGSHAVAFHTELFRCTGYPRLQQLIRLVIGPVGLRYDKALSYPFPDSWDVLLELAVARYEAVRARDLDRVVSDVRRLRAILHAKHRQRLELPEVARYFRED